MSIADKLTTIAENIPRVYQAGYDKGVAEGDGYDAGYAQGEADGRKAEHDEFWDSYQNYGNRTDYDSAFKGIFWKEQNFKPKYDIAPTGRATYLFGGGALARVDLTQLLKKAGVILDLSNATHIGYSFQGNPGVSRVPIIDASKSLVTLNEAFRLSYALEVIDGLILQADGSNTWHITFDGTSALREISKIEGVIGNAIDLKACPLNKETIIRVINALSGTTTGKTCTFSKYRVNKEFETEEGKLDGTTTTEWLDLIATKPNWTISLA